MLFKNLKYSGEKCHVLFVVHEDFKDVVGREFVKRILNPEGFFKYFNCNEIEVSVVKPKKLRMNISGCRYESIHFIGNGFCGEDIMYCLTRLHSRIEMRKKPIKSIE